MEFLRSARKREIQNLCLKIASDDNVAVAVKPLRSGMELEVEGHRRIVLHTDVPAGQKVALIHLETGDLVVKYGYPIGYITQCVDCGEWIHGINARMAVVGHLEYTVRSRPETLADLWNRDIYRGYMRKNGEAGIRNEVWIIPVSAALERVASQLADEESPVDKSGIDRIAAFPCRDSFFESAGRDDDAARIWQRWISHPDAGGVLVIALKKDMERMNALKSALGKYDASRVRFVAVKDEISGYDSLLKPLCGLVVRASGCIPVEVHVSSLRLD